MLQQIRIQNFKSLQDVTFDLQQVNLFIGPNNSGKSNVFKALEFFSEFIKGHYPKNKAEFDTFTFQQKGVMGTTIKNLHPITFTFRNHDDVGGLYWIYQIEIYGYLLQDNRIECSEMTGYAEKEIKKEFTLRDVNYLNEHFVEYEYGCLSNKYFLTYEKIKDVSFPEFSTQDSIHFTKKEKIYTNLMNVGMGIGTILRSSIIGGIHIHLDDIVKSFKIYRPDVNKMKLSNPIKGGETLNADASNLATFLFNFSQNHSKEFEQLEGDLKSCVKEITRLRTPGARDKEGHVEIKVFDDSGNGYWANEVSEGVLYFLALLAIVYQPNPPQLLLLEEPELGIHPRRIAEILEFVYRLAEEKNIQIIMTTHSPVMVDKFADATESVFVFDKLNGATVIKNLLKDIIEPSEKEAGENKIEYTQSLGEHWTMGFLGGVPK